MLYCIGDLIVKYNAKYSLLNSRSEKFLHFNQKAKEDISIRVTQEEIEKYKEQYKAEDDAAVEYTLAGVRLFEKIIQNDGFVLHSSAVCIDNEAYVFIGTSGTGKSTHAKMWIEMFDERAKYINDDKPIIRIIDGVACCCGTPFSGKNDLSNNIIVPIRGIYLLQQAKQNKAVPLSKREALAAVMSQSYSSQNHDDVLKHLSLVEKIVMNVPVLKMECNISAEAVYVAYHAV